MRTAVTVLRKDLLLELRTLETVPAMVLFSLTTFVIFHFALNRATISGQLAAGVLTATLLFAAMLAINRLFVAEREQGGFDAFLLAPVDRTAAADGEGRGAVHLSARARGDRRAGVRAAAARPLARTAVARADRCPGVGERRGSR